MRLTEAHTISNGEKTLVAVIDSGIDSTHPEIAGAITQSCDAVTESCGFIGGGNPDEARQGT
jgi:subtilisin family serine protease